MSDFHELSPGQISALKSLLPTDLAYKVENAWLNGTLPPGDDRIKKFVNLVWDWPKLYIDKTILIVGSSVSVNQMTDLMARYGLPGYVRLRRYGGGMLIEDADVNKLQQYMLISHASSAEEYEYDA